MDKLMDDFNFNKPVIISSSGLKNIVLNKYQEDDDFIFVFGEEKFQMKSIFAEYQT